MNKLLSLAALGLTSAGLTLATPSESQAQSPFGVSVNFGRGGFSYQQGYYGQGGSFYYGPYSYSGYSSQPYCDQGYSYYGGYQGGYSRRPVVVHPETYHWTPNRGIHSHGHIHVPYRGGYYTRPY